MSPFEEKAAQLKKLKELLDSGAITHEEFDEMKKEILEKGSTANWGKNKSPQNVPLNQKSDFSDQRTFQRQQQKNNCKRTYALFS